MLSKADTEKAVCICMFVICGLRVATVRNEEQEEIHQTFSVKRELLEPSAECRLLPRAARGERSEFGDMNGFGDIGGLSVERLLSSNGFSSGWRMTGVLAGLGRRFSIPARPAKDSSPTSFSKSPPNSLFRPPEPP